MERGRGRNQPFTRCDGLPLQGPDAARNLPVIVWRAPLCPLGRIAATRRRCVALVITLTLIGTGIPPLLAADTGDAIPESEALPGESLHADDILQGLIIDHTVTFIGRNFYYHFSKAWSEQAIHGDYNLTVYEQPTAHSGSRVWVEWDRRNVYQVFLSPASRDIQAAAENAARTIARRLEVIELQKSLFNNPDLAPDEL